MHGNELSATAGRGVKRADITSEKALVLERDAARLFAMGRISDAMRNLPGAGPAAKVLCAGAAKKLRSRARHGPDGERWRILAGLVEAGRWPPIEQITGPAAPVVV
jgi:hypothetical protein